MQVVCLDLDTRHVDDEDTLSYISASHYDEHGIMYEEPLPPGAPLWPALVEEAAEARAAAEAAKAAADASAAGEPAEGAGEGAVEPGVDATGVDVPGEVGELKPGAASPSVACVTPPRMVAVVTGPPMCGTSTQAARLAARYGVPLTTFDELLFEGADAEAEPAPAPAVAHQGEAHQGEAGEAGTPAQEATAEAASEGGAVEAPAAYFDAEISDLLYEKVRQKYSLALPWALFRSLSVQEQF